MKLKIRDGRKTGAQRRATVLTAALSMFIAALLLLPGSAALATASRTPAGTIIRNHAVVTFQGNDATGQVFTSTSNEVIMEILPVYGLELQPDGDAPPGTPGQSRQVISAAPNVQVVFNYTLLFTGNIADNATITPAFNHTASTFLPKLGDGDTGFIVYKDCNFNGIIDAGDIQVASWRDVNSNGQREPGELQIGDLGCKYDPGVVVSLLLTFYVPAGLPAGRVTYVGLEATSVGNPVVKDPEGPPPLTQKIAEAIVVSDAVMTVVKAANLTQVAPGDTITYTVTARSAGNTPALRRDYTVDGNVNSHSGVLVFDVIPNAAGTGTPLPINNQTIVSEPPGVTGQFIYSAQPNTALDPEDPSWAWHAVYAAGDTVIAYITSAGGSDFDFADDESASFSFDATVPATEPDQILTNKAYAHYGTNALGTKTVKAVNDVLVAVVGATGVLIRDTDFEAPVPPLTPADDGGGITNDTQTVALAQAGSFIYFTNRVLNTGARTDSFNISVDAATSNPNGWTFAFFKSDGVTPLRDTGTDGIIDTGPLNPAGTNLAAPLAYTDIVVRLQIPENAATTLNDPELSLVIKATSVNNSTQSDTTANIITDVTAAALNLANHTAPPSGPLNPVVQTKTADAGGFVDFPLVVRNQAPAAPDGEFDTYVMSVPTLPAGWDVVFYADLNQNAVLDGNELLPITNTPAVQPQSNTYLIARVVVPAAAVADLNNDTFQDNYSVIFRATSTNNPAVSDDQQDLVQVNWRNHFELRPDRSGVGEPGGTVAYTHVLQNYGERPNRFYLEITPGSTDWSYILYDLGEPAVQLPREVIPGPHLNKYYIDLDEAGGATDQASLQLRIFIPANAPVHTVDITTVTASARDFGIAATSSAVDITRIVASDLVMVKSVAPAGAVDPGTVLTYTTTFFNKSAGPLTSVVIYDQIPAYVEFVNASQSSSLDPAVTYHVSTDGGASWVAPGALGPTVTNLRATLQNPLPAGQQHTLVFQVQVK